MTRRKFGISLMTIFPCKDGEVSFRLMPGKLGHQLTALVEWMRTEHSEGTLGQVLDWNAVDNMEINQDQINSWQESIADFFIKHTKAEIFEQASRRGLFIGRVNTIKDLVSDVQLSAREFWVKVAHPKLATEITYPNIPFRFSEATTSFHRSAPSIGEHNEEIYVHEMGISHNELLRLKQAHII